MKNTDEIILDSDWDDSEGIIDNEAFFNDLVSGLTSATKRMREENAREMLRDTLEWVGRVPGNAQEQKRLLEVRERAEAVLAK